MRIFFVGKWQVQPSTNTIHRRGLEVRLEPRTMDVLRFLADKQGQVVSKQQLIDVVWEGRFVGDEVITNAIWELRKSFGDNARQPSYIQTIPKRGYRLIASISKSDPLGKRGLRVTLAACVLLGLSGSLGWLVISDRIPILPDGIARATEERPVSFEAWEAYLRGRFFWNKRSQQGLSRSIESFEEAIRLDPSFSRAHAGLADALSMMVDYQYAAPADLLPRARREASRALQLSPHSAEALTSDAWIRWVWEWDVDGAEAGFQAALKLDPNYPTAHHWYAALLKVKGRDEESTYHVAKAARLDPLSPVFWMTSAHFALLRGELEEASSLYHKTLELSPDHLQAVKGLVWVYSMRGDAEQAERYFQVMSKLPGGELYALFHEPAMLSLADGREAPLLSDGEFQTALRSLHELAGQRYVSPIVFAGVCAQAGRDREALIWLEEALRQRGRDIFMVSEHPHFHRLAESSGFKDLLRRLPIPPSV